MRWDQLQSKLCEVLSSALVNSEPLPRVPEAGRVYWLWFADLHQTRTHGMSGPNPISCMEMEAYFRLHRIATHASHLDLIHALDRTYLEHARSQLGNDAKEGRAAPMSSGQSVNPQAFDAVFG